MQINIISLIELSQSFIAETTFSRLEKAELARPVDFPQLTPTMSEEHSAPPATGQTPQKPSDKPAAETEEEKLASDAFTTEDRLRQAKEIEDEIKKKPLVGWKERGLDSLFEEFKANPSFLRKLPHLGSKYSHLRRIRGDGNCFYRGFCFLLVEQLIDNESMFEMVKNKIDTSLDYLLEVGYTQTAVEFFVEEAQRFFNESFPKNEVELETYFANNEESMYLVWFLRLLTAGYLKHHWEERFKFFVDSIYVDANDFCSREVIIYIILFIRKTLNKICFRWNLQIKNVNKFKLLRYVNSSESVPVWSTWIRMRQVTKRWRTTSGQKTRK